MGADGSAADVPNGADIPSIGADRVVPPGVDVMVSPGTDVPTLPGGGRRYWAGDHWAYQDIAMAAVDRDSPMVIDFLAGLPGFGGGRMQIDFSIEVLDADDTPPVVFTRTGDWYDPDCDGDPMLLPTNGNLEGEMGYQCVSDGDCHLIVWQRSTNRLFEMWRANAMGRALSGGCLAVWRTDRVPPPEGRGQDCSSADAGGLPIAPLLFDADEVAAGTVAHALRMILPNTSIRRLQYVHPATHSTRSATGGMNTPPYGARFRLRADYPLNSLPSNGARVVARALQQYGMILTDGGNLTLTGRSDQRTVRKWDGLLAPRDLIGLTPRDFAMVDGGTRFTYAGNCVRQPR